MNNETAESRNKHLARARAARLAACIASRNQELKLVRGANENLRISFVSILNVKFKIASRLDKRKRSF